MTIYTGHIVEAVTFLQEAVEDVGDLEAAGSYDLAVLRKASQTLRDATDVAIASLDPQIGSGGSGGLAEAVEGVFAPDLARIVGEQLASIEQQEKLVDLRGYAGRVLINIEQAG
jgi:hypothetical protein